ncbi:leucyl aminopeptidase [Peziza echinospora]|nr:leucyl aminopeptidase [Peziza echinospora]
MLKVCCYIEEFPSNDRNLAWKIRQLIEHYEASSYRFDIYKSKTNPMDAKSLQSLSFYIADNTQKTEAEIAISEAKAIAAGIALKKDLANRPANHCTPSDVAQAAQTLADQYRLKIEVLNQDHPEVAKMGAFLSVARGSEEPPKFVVVHYKPESAKEIAPVVLVGKGVTFDSGGISIKPSAKMDEMKFDMAGAASVLGTLKAVAELKLPISVIGILPLTENLPSGKATKPGDVVTTLSGQTVEILNTDAEGRLILADALTYSERFNPSVVIDIATLTGAIVVALGPVATGLMSNDNELVNALETASQQSFDRVWRLPLWEDYQEFINGNVADISNTGDGSGAGSITAACFLARFTRKKPFQWAHLDIAGTAWKSEKGKVAATGRPVSLLVQYLINRSQGS